MKQGAKIDGKDGVFAPLTKQLTEAVLEAEIESHLSIRRVIYTTVSGVYVGMNKSFKLKMVYEHLLN